MTRNTPKNQIESTHISPTDVIGNLNLFHDGNYQVPQGERHEQTIRIAAEHALVTLVLNDPIILGRGPTHSISALTALGKRCVDAYKSGDWGKILYGFRDCGKEPTLEEMIAALSGNASKVITR